MSYLSDDPEVRALEKRLLGALETALWMIRTEQPLADIDAYRAKMGAEFAGQDVVGTFDALLARLESLVGPFVSEGERA